MGAFSAQRDPKTGDVWFTILEGQVFRVRDTRMQYCFGYTAGASSPGRCSSHAYAWLGVYRESQMKYTFGAASE